MAINAFPKEAFNPADLDKLRVQISNDILRIFAYPFEFTPDRPAVYTEFVIDDEGFGV